MNKKALIPILIYITGIVLSPDFYNKLPDKYAHILGGLAVIIGALLPQLVVKNASGQTSK